MTDQAKHILQFFKVDEVLDEELINQFNLFDKGNDCIILHLGSHSIKFGLGSMSQPFLVPNAIAHPTKNDKTLISDYQQALQLD
jgi:hypothetical protein